ncbi:UNVERIFIED_CONTAM: hypothetical protein GTU68_030121 [Idotea baltica]|nr:hypothetical protein [Idotea baltica]
MYRGNFEFDNYLIKRLPLRSFEITKHTDKHYEIELTAYTRKFYCHFRLSDSKLDIEFDRGTFPEQYNRFWIRLTADVDEKVYGCGEQLSYFNLRGKNFPLWTSEPGVGRDKSSFVTWQADVKDKAGGDYYSTNYPQSTFMSSRKYFCHLDSTAYMDFNFRNSHFHELACSEIPKKITFDTADTYLNLVSKIANFFGGNQELPEWVYNGVILGIQDGTEVVLEKTKAAIDAGVEVSAIWAQDWQGQRRTSFGKRLNWNWQWNKELYPNLDKELSVLKQDGIRFLGYINPYLVKDYPLYKEGLELGYYATDKDGGEYTVDFGEFDCAVVDFTNPKAYQWYKDRVIKKELIEFGLDGWMADFGEYLPTDCKLYDGTDATMAHNDWPRLWAKANFEAVEESGKLGEILYFMRAGFNGFQPYNLLLWAGDQCVDFSLHDGLASVIPAALSAGISGMGLSHSDIGGYTTLHGLKRSKELFMRWAEMAAFTPVMRTHEGSSPELNYQFNEDVEGLAHFAKMTKVYKHLKPYIKELVRINANDGIPVQRPLFMHYEDDVITYDIQYQYMFGKDILVAPVYKDNKEQWLVYLPEDNWVHIFTGEKYNGGEVTVNAPLGCPPVFYREDSEYKELFSKVINIV